MPGISISLSMSLSRTEMVSSPNDSYIFWAIFLDIPLNMPHERYATISSSVLFTYSCHEITLKLLPYLAVVNSSVAKSKVIFFVTGRFVPMLIEV